MVGMTRPVGQIRCATARRSAVPTNRSIVIVSPVIGWPSVLKLKYWMTAPGASVIRGWSHRFHALEEKPAF